MTLNVQFIQMGCLVVLFERPFSVVGILILTIYTHNSDVNCIVEFYLI